jgi:hypothetical protein
MIAYLLRLIGIGDDFLAHLDEVSLTVQRPAILWLGFLLLVPIAAFIYRRQRSHLSSVPRGLIIALSAIRVTILTMLVTVLAGPYLKIDHRDEKKPIVALLIDGSESMQIPAGPFGQKEATQFAKAAGLQIPNGKLDPETTKSLNRLTRASLTHSVLQAAAHTVLEPLHRKYDLRCSSFAGELTSIPLDPARLELPEPASPGGNSTHLGDAVSQVLHESAGRQMAGIIVLSDGQATGGRSVAEAAHAAADAGVPIYSVPAGMSTRLRDVAIVDVFTSGLVSVGDNARIAVTIESEGFDGRPVKVELREGEKLLDKKDLILRGAEQQQIELTFQAEEPGAHYLTVNIPPQPEEPEFLRANNTDVAFVRVSDEKLRLLYIEGMPRWDFRFLKNAMRRDHGLAGLQDKEPDLLLESEVRRQSAGQRGLPSTLDDLAKYHTVILGDASPALLNGRFLTLLAEAVRERGVGLIVEAGPRHMPQAYDETLLDLLPVRLRAHSSGLEAPVYKPFRFELSSEGAIHEAMRLYDDPGRNQNVWSSMPAYYWCAATERPAPGASVLAWNPSIEGRYGRLPLIAHQYAGKGRVLFLGTDSTWGWRQNVGDRFFYKFWGQSIRFVARHDEKSKKSWIEVRPMRAQPGESTQIELMAVTEAGLPRTEATLPVRVVYGETITVLDLTADPAAKGRYTGRFVPQTPGTYRITFDSGNGTVEARLRVLAGVEEMRHPNVNRPALELLASVSGGKLVELPDLGSIPDMLKGESKFVDVHREATVWDNWLTLVVLACLYSVDVGLRRLAGLS